MVSGQSKLQVMQFFLPGTPGQQAAGRRPPEGKSTHRKSEGLGERPTQGGSAEVSGSYCDSQPVGPGYVEEVTACHQPTLGPAARALLCWALVDKGLAGVGLRALSAVLQPTSHPSPGKPVSRTELPGRARHWVSDPRRKAGGRHRHIFLGSPHPVGRKVEGGSHALEGWVTAAPQGTCFWGQ